ncbi:hypothetical protein PS2_003138 [Malus domestica]
MTEKAQLHRVESQQKVFSFDTDTRIDTFVLCFLIFDFCLSFRSRRWLEEIDRKQAELIAVQIALEKLKQKSLLVFVLPVGGTLMSILMRSNDWCKTKGWDQSNQVGTSQPPQDSSGYNYYGQPQNPRFNYNQTPNVASHGYDRAYAQQPPSYGGQAPVSDYQQQYATSGYGSPAVPSIRDATATQSSTGQPHPGYYQAAYGHGEYHQPDIHYAPSVNPPTNGESQHRQQGHSELPTNGYEEPSGYGAERTGDKEFRWGWVGPAAETISSEI